MFKLEIKKTSDTNKLTKAIDVSDAIDKLYLYPEDKIEMSISNVKMMFPRSVAFSVSVMRLDI